MNLFKKFFPHLLFLLVLYTITILPIYVQTAKTPKGTYFTKPPHNIPPPDYYAYILVINQGRHGSWGEINQFSVEPSTPFTLYTYYLFLGHIAKYIGLSNIAIFHLANALNLFIFYVACNLLIGLFFKKQRYRWLVLLIIFFASPLPPLNYPVIGKVIKVNIDIIWTYLDIYCRLFPRPHFLLGEGLTIGAIYFFLRYTKETKHYMAVISAALLGTAFVVFAVPATIFLMSLGIIFTTYLISLCQYFLNQDAENLKITIAFIKKTFFGWIFLFAVSGLAELYIYRQLYTLGEPWTRFITWEADTYNPKGYPFTFSVLFFSYGLLPLFSIFSLASFIRKLKIEYFLILLMAIIPPIMYLLAENGFLYINKIRFAYTAPYVFLGIMATDGILKMIKLIKKEALISFFIVIFLVNGALGLYFYWYPFVTFNQIYNDRYIPLKYIYAMNYLANNTPPFSNVLANYNAGNAIPAFTLNKVFIGHEVATLDFFNKINMVDSFFIGQMSVDIVKDMFNKYSIDYVVWADYSFPEKYKSVLKPIYNYENLVIYKTVFK
mgnify:CR=1 FL=1